MSQWYGNGKWFAGKYFEEWFGAVAVPVPPPVPVPVRPARAAVGVGGPSFLTPWQPLFQVPSQCFDAFNHVVQRPLHPECEPDPIKVKREIEKTRQRIRENELKALRKTVARLTSELEISQAARVALEQAQARIAHLEHLLSLGRPWTPALWKPAGTWRPVEVSLPKPQPETVPASVPQAPVFIITPPPPLPPPSRWGPAIQNSLPYAGAAAFLALGTYYLVSDEDPLVKFIGYGLSLISTAKGVSVLLETLNQPPSEVEFS